MLYSFKSSASWLHFTSSIKTRPFSHNLNNICTTLWIPWRQHQKPQVFLQDQSIQPIFDRICDLVEHTQFPHPANKNKYIRVHYVNADNSSWCMYTTLCTSLGYWTSWHQWKLFGSLTRCNKITQFLYE